MTEVPVPGEFWQHQGQLAAEKRFKGSKYTEPQGPNTPSRNTDHIGCFISMVGQILLP